MIQFKLKQEIDGLATTLAKVQRTTEDKLRMIAEAVGIKTIAYLKSLTDEVRPPGYKGKGKGWTGPRQAHPGHWADISTVLVNSYSHHVDVSPGLVTLELRNGAEYAAYLDAHEGYFVLRGVTDPGGPVEEALQSAVAIVAPGWVVRRG